MNAHPRITTAVAAPLHPLDFNEIELQLANAKQMAGVLHTLLELLPPAPAQSFPKIEGPIFVLNRHDLEQLQFAAFQTVSFAQAAETALDEQLSRLSGEGV